VATIPCRIVDLWPPGDRRGYSSTWAVAITSLEITPENGAGARRRSKTAQGLGRNRRAEPQRAFGGGLRAATKLWCRRTDALDLVPNTGGWTCSTPANLRPTGTSWQDQWAKAQLVLPDGFSPLVTLGRSVAHGRAGVGEGAPSRGAVDGGSGRRLVIRAVAVLTESQLHDAECPGYPEVVVPFWNATPEPWAACMLGTSN
jgi:hypothetical protein